MSGPLPWVGERSGLGVPAPQAAASPLTTWTVSLEAVDRWLKGSRPGERLIYAHGPNLADPTLAARMRALAAAGEVRMLPLQRSAGDGAFDYAVQRTEPAPAAPVAATPDLFMVALFGRIERAARRGLRCPTDGELAADLELTVGQVKWRFKKLVEAGRIASRIEPANGNAHFRVVTILSTKRETARPAR